VSALNDLLALPSGQKSLRGLEFTPREIAQQPDTWAMTFMLFEKRRAEIVAFLDAAGIFNEIGQRPTVFLLGAGTSDYIGRALANLLRHEWQCEVIVVPSTDAVTHFEELLLPHQKYLWISFSRSGDSPESAAAIEKAQIARPNIHHLIVSCNPQGRMVAAAESNKKSLAIVLDDCVNDRGLAMTSSFSNMVIFGQCLAHVSDIGPYHDLLSRLITAGDSLLESAPDCAAKLASSNYANASFVGSGPLRAVASECALKMLELTAGKSPTMSESALGLRHGPMSALSDETLFVCFVSSDPQVRRYEADLLREIGDKRLAKTRVAIGPLAAQEGLAEDILNIGNGSPIPDLYRAPCDVIFGQLLGLFFSLHWGLKPDQPSPSGAISRVVQGVTIYG
jgi:tagatose-6-phosphate ketose/aldose isomerase